MDSGNAWGTGDVTTVDHTLIRNSSITAGDKNPNDDFDPAKEWTGLPNGTYTELGSHTMDGISTPVETKVEAVAASTPSSDVPSGTAITLSTKTADEKINYTTDGSMPTTEVRCIQHQSLLIKI